MNEKELGLWAEQLKQHWQVSSPWLRPKLWTPGLSNIFFILIKFSSGGLLNRQIKQRREKNQYFSTDLDISNLQQLTDWSRNDCSYSLTCLYEYLIVNCSFQDLRSKWQQRLEFDCQVDFQYDPITIKLFILMSKCGNYLLRNSTSWLFCFIRLMGLACPLHSLLS